jgi:NAD+ kinase
MKLSTYDVLGRPEDVKPVIEIIRKYDHFKQDTVSPSFYVLVGGDGTLIYKRNKLKLYKRPNAPVLHVHYRSNTDKTQGFAADINLRNIDRALKDIINEQYFIREEKLIDFILNGERKDSAINDVTIQHKKRFATLLFEAVVDKGNEKLPFSLEILPSPKPDMLLVCTPYGSTAWNLAIGGPIHIDSDCMGINIVNTPTKHEHYICKMEHVLNVKLFCDAIVGVDGAGSVYRTKEGSEISISQSDRRIKIIRTTYTFENLASKIQRQIEFAKQSMVKTR